VTFPNIETLGLADTVAGVLDDTDTPGAAVAFLVDGEPALDTGVGYRDLERETPLDASARFYLYSVTKTLLAIASLRLVEQGRLALDAAIATVLPEIELPHDVTLRRLLNHTSGLADYGAMPEYAADLEADAGAPWSDETFLERVLSRGPLFEPGEGWSYSNVGYMLVRMALTRVTDQQLGEVLAEGVFDRLGLGETGVATTMTDSRALTPGFSTELGRDGVVRDVAGRYHPGWVSHGVVVSTAQETAHILDALFEGRLIRSELLAEMLRAEAVPGTHRLFARPGYGLGIMMDRDPAVGLVAGHAGGGPGYSTAAFCFRPARGPRLTVVALANRDAGEVGMRITFAVARRYMERAR
jgi:D-alanyl-D-alanine carboxypeptidase